MNETKRLKELRASLFGEMRKLSETLKGDKKDFTAEERQTWDRLNREFDEAGRTLEVLERTASVAKLIEARAEDVPGLENRGVGESKRSRKERAAEAKTIAAAHELAVRAWAKRAHGKKLSKREEQACKLIRFNPNARSLTIRLGTRPGETRALSVGTTTAGGYLVPQGFVNSLEKQMAAFGGVRAVADVMRTDSGNPLPWPTANDTGNTGELLAENTDAADAGADPAFGQVLFGAYKYSSRVVRISEELIEDSAFDMASEVGGMLGERLGRVQAPHFATGTGSGQPAGIVTGSSLGKTAASATALAADELIDLFHSVNPAYRTDPSFGWLMNDSTLAAVRKLKDGQGNYLWQMGNVQTGAPEMLLGRPIAIDLSMPAIATGAKPIVIGPLKKFKIRDVNKVRFRRLVERYAERDQTGFVAFVRSDSKVLAASATSPIKHLVMA